MPNIYNNTKILLITVYLLLFSAGAALTKGGVEFSLIGYGCAILVFFSSWNEIMALLEPNRRILLLCLIIMNLLSPFLLYLSGFIYILIVCMLLIAWFVIMAEIDFK